MELIIGTNSYMSVEDADKLVHDNYASTDPERVYWDSLSNDDKSIYIYKTTQEIERPFFFWKGVKADIHQNMVWPRKINNTVVNVPERVLLGIINNILHNGVMSASEEAKLKDMGVEEFKDGSGAMIRFFDNERHNKYLERLADSSLYKYITEQYFGDWLLTVN